MRGIGLQAGFATVRGLSVAIRVAVCTTDLTGSAAAVRRTVRVLAPHGTPAVVRRRAGIARIAGVHGAIMEHAPAVEP
jgi:hypothetical protein